MNDIKTIYNKINNSKSSTTNYVFALNPNDLVQVENSPNESECEISESEFEDAVNCYLSGGNVYIQTAYTIYNVSVINVKPQKGLLFTYPSITETETVYLYVANKGDSGGGKQ